MASTSVVFDILARDRASDKFDKFGRSVDGSSSKVSKLGGIMKTAGKAAAIGLGAGIVIAGKALFDATKGAIADEQAQIRLANQLRNSTGATDKQIASTEDWISKTGAMLGVTDDELRPALAKLATATGDVAKAQDLAALAMDVSAATGKSLESVSTALMKAQNGQVSSLSRLGVETTNAKGKTLDFNTVVGQMAATFNGAAVTAANTTAGKFERLKVMFDETKEAIGARLIPMAENLADWFFDKGMPAVQGLAGEFQTRFLPVLKDVGTVLLDVGQKVVDVAQFFDRHRTAAVVLGGAIGALVVVTQIHAALLAVTAAGGLAAWLKGTRIVTAATKTWAAVQWVLNAAMTANPIGIVIVALAALTAGVIIAYKKSETFRKIVDGAFSAVKKAAEAVLGFFKAQWPKILVILTGPIGLATVAIIKNWDKIKSAGSAVIGWVKEIPGKLRGLADGFGNAGRALIGAFVDGMKNAAGVIGGIAGNVWDAVKSMLNAAIDKINAALEFTISLPGPNITVNPSNIPHLAKGGIVTGPTVALIGEAGPEAVVPLGRMAPSVGGGGLTININGALDPVAVGRQVEQILVKHARTTGKPLQVRTI